MSDKTCESVQRCIATNAIIELLNIQTGVKPTQDEVLQEYRRRADVAREQIASASVGMSVSA